jgi:hypothetical protein
VNYFFLRLTGPRPDFALTLTAEERALMQAHGVYWNGLLEKGAALAFGLVLHPESPFGVCIAKGSDLQEVERMSLEDPVTKSGLGFRWEIYPMRASVRATP